MGARLHLRTGRDAACRCIALSVLHMEEVVIGSVSCLAGTLRGLAPAMLVGIHRPELGGNLGIAGMLCGRCASAAL